MNVRDVRKVVRLVTTGELDTATEAAAHLQETDKMEVSADTVRRELHKTGMKAAVKVKKPLLRARHIKDRFLFAQRHKDWTVEDC
jgi:hypothetical protein